MKILFLVPDGVGIRNYLYSNILIELKSLGHEIIIGHTISNKALEEVEEIHKTKFVTLKLPIYKESILEKFLREAICFARLQYNAKVRSNTTLMKNWSPVRNKALQKIFYNVVELIASISSSYKWISYLEFFYISRLNKSSYLNSFELFLNNIQPDVIFNTHQRSLNVIPIMIAAKKIKCKTISAIYSWDNLPKARLNAKADEYFVWSEYMRKEMEVYYPEISKEKIKITGTPQFDFYKNKKLFWKKKDFCEKFDLDAGRPIICFSGDDMRTSPYDPDYLQDLAESIKQSESKHKVQVLFRRCPVDLSGRYEQVIEKYSDIIKVANPLWNNDKKDDSWSLVYPSYADVKLLVNMALHCDGVYNVGSTMAHDFAMFNKPGLYINYDHTSTQQWKTNVIYQFEHFKSMTGLNAVVWINSKEEIESKIKDVLLSKKSIAPDRLKWLHTVNLNVENTSKLIAETIGKE